jgi:hypothetical protein
MLNKVLAIVLCLFVQASASACSRFLYTAPIFDEGSAALKAADREKLMNWLDESLRIFPYVSVISIESHAYAPTKEKAQELAKARSIYIKEKLLQQLPQDTVFDAHYYGHTSKKEQWFFMPYDRNNPKQIGDPPAGMVSVALYPDVDKLGLPSCELQVPEGATQRSTSALACSHPLYIYPVFDEGSVALKAADRENLMNWLDASLRTFPYVSNIVISSHAYANTKEKAQELAKSRSAYIKEKLLQQLPKDTVFDVYHSEHLSRNVGSWGSPDTTMIDLFPDVDKLGLSLCGPSPPEDAAQR